METKRKQESETPAQSMVALGITVVAIGILTAGYALVTYMAPAPAKKTRPRPHYLRRVK